MDLVLGSLDVISPGEGRAFESWSDRVAVFRTRTDQVFAVQAQCPHRGGPLADGLLGGTTLVCPLHSWKFDLATGTPLLGTCGLQTYAVRVDAARRIVLSL